MLSKQVYEYPGATVPLEIVTATTSNNAHILLLGSGHDLDPGHDPLETHAVKYGRGIEAFDEWVAHTEGEPRLVIHEDRKKTLGPSLREAVHTNGEAGFMRYLAHSHGIPYASGEPTFAEEISSPLFTYDRDDVALFLTVRILPWLRQAMEHDEDPDKKFTLYMQDYEELGITLRAAKKLYKHRYGIVFNPYDIPEEAHNEGLLICEPARHRAPETEDEGYKVLRHIKEQVRRARTASFFNKTVGVAVAGNQSVAAWFGLTHVRAMHAEMQRWPEHFAEAKR